VEAAAVVELALEAVTDDQMDWGILRFHLAVQMGVAGPDPSLAFSVLSP
jgi:hypothetical protein